ncbi:MAG: galactokinase [Acidimicrobiia bacterium]|nr:galactokinase [Acidimicrobiia bacterium]MDH5615931.1 galactokinase [Acidimicrobiia bacterium]
MSAKDRVGIHFTTKYEASATSRVRVPSRANLIGEHTDYNEGYVLPFAVDREMWFAFRPRIDQTVHIRSESFVDEVIFDLKHVTKGTGWGEYVKGVAWALSATGRELRGWDGFLASDIPMGAGMSSSAALCIGSAVAFAVASDFYLEARELAELSQRSENAWVGVDSGIMDPLVMAGGHRGYAQLIDCRTITAEDIAMSSETVSAILDTGTRRGHVVSAYNQRREECFEAARHFGISSLRDLDQETLESKGVGLPDAIYRRARHVVTENERTLRAADALRVGDAVTIGRLMVESHESLRDDYEVSSRPLDAMVIAANSAPGCFGARMMGGGFGGVAVALVDRSRATEFEKVVADSYTEITGLPAHVHLAEAVDGVVALPGTAS